MKTILLALIAAAALQTCENVYAIRTHVAPETLTDKWLCEHHEMNQDKCE